MPSCAIDTTDGDLQKQDFDHGQSVGSWNYGTLPTASGAVQVHIHRVFSGAKKKQFSDCRFIRHCLCVCLQLPTFMESLRCFTVCVLERESPQRWRTWKELSSCFFLCAAGSQCASAHWQLARAPCSFRIDSLAQLREGSESPGSDLVTLVCPVQMQKRTQHSKQNLCLAPVVHMLFKGSHFSLLKKKKN